MNKRIKKKKRKQYSNRMNAILWCITRYYPKMPRFLCLDDILKFTCISERDIQQLNENWMRTNNAYEEYRNRIINRVNKNFDISILPDEYAFK